MTKQVIATMLAFIHATHDPTAINVTALSSERLKTDSPKT